MKHLYLVVISLVILSCGRDPKVEKEQLRLEAEIDPSQPKDTTNSVTGGLELSQIATYPQQVILNGMPQHRLISVYKFLPKKNEGSTSRSSYDSYSYDRGESWDGGEYNHFMPGIDLLFGYNLLNLMHYDMKSETSNYLFSRPVLIKSVYFPSYDPDSVGEKPNRKPIIRDYFLVSAYDEDTNKDTLLNRHDLRRFYHFNASCDVKTQLIPPDYSVVRSQYDSDNDVMYIYARHDDNKNGRSENTEALHVFWVSLKNPAPAKRMY